MKKIIFTSFAGGTDQLRSSASRIRMEAIESKFFDRVCVFDDLTPPSHVKNFLNNYPDILHERGYGFWAWKPHLLLDALTICSEGDIIVYADAGCQISNFGKSQFDLNISICKTHGSLFFSMPKYIEKNWTKKTLLEYFGVLGNVFILNSPQIQATYFYVEVNDLNKEMLMKWADISVTNNFYYINDNESFGVEKNNFFEHRHDQSILSILVKKYDMHIQKYECHFRSFEYFINSRILLFPFHSLRTRGSRIKHFLAFKYSVLNYILSDIKPIKLLNYFLYLLNLQKVALFFVIKKIVIFFK